jgi:uncharacterized protein (DUF3084 family)
LEIKHEGKIEMGGDIDALTAERDRIESELARLDERQATLEKERAEITRKTEAAAGDTETLAQLKIETEQMVEAKHTNDRLIAQTKKRLAEVEEIIGMQEQSDMT